MRVESFVVVQPGQPMARQFRDEIPGTGEVLVEVAGCGVCHTDLGFFYDGVPTRQPFPLTLGHEISGTRRRGRAPAPRPGWARPSSSRRCIPCGECDACRAGRGQICPKQIFPGNDVHGGFGTHVRVPARGLCRVPDSRTRAINPAGLELASLVGDRRRGLDAVPGDPPQRALRRRPRRVRRRRRRRRLRRADRRGAAARTSVAIDVDDARLREPRAVRRRADAQFRAPDDAKALRKQVRDFAEARGIPTWRCEDLRDLGHPPARPRPSGCSATAR